MKTEDIPPNSYLQDRREFLKKSALGAAVVTGSGLFAGTAPAALRRLTSTTHNVIGFSHPFSDAPVVHYVQRFAQERAKQLGYKVLIDSERGKLDLQVASIESWITQRVDAIVCLPLEPSTLEQLAKKARKRGILWFSYYQALKNQDGFVGISQSNSGEILGKYAANWINKNLGGRAEVAIFTYKSLSFGHLRTDPLARWIKTATKAKIVASQDALDQPTGLSVTEDILTAHPNLNVVLGINDDGVLGAYRAFQNAGKDPKKCFLAGQDGTKDGILAVLQGKHYKATSAVRLRDVGYKVVDLPAQVLEGGSRGSAIVPVQLITPKRRALAATYLSDYGVHIKP